MSGEFWKCLAKEFDLPDDISRWNAWRQFQIVRRGSNEFRVLCQIILKIGCVTYHAIRYTDDIRPMPIIVIVITMVSQNTHKSCDRGGHFAQLSSLAPINNFLVSWFWTLGTQLGKWPALSLNLGVFWDTLHSHKFTTIENGMTS